jgi:hypothetical protein
MLIISSYCQESAGGSLILATWEAEIRTVTVAGQPWRIVLETLSPK